MNRPCGPSRCQQCIDLQIPCLVVEDIIWDGQNWVEFPSRKIVVYGESTHD